MRTWTKFTLVSLVTGVPALALTPVLFPLNPHVPAPSDDLIPYFAFLVGVESLFFGFGVAFLAVGLPLMRRVSRISGISPWPAYLGVGYTMTSWWPHLGMHRAVGLDPEGLLLVDFVFHLPYILATGIVAHFFVSTIRAAARQSALPVLPAWQGGRIEDGTVNLG